MIPRQPTPAMIKAAQEAVSGFPRSAAIEAIWIAMWDAASGMSAGTAETAQQAQGKARQPDPKGDAPMKPWKVDTTIFTDVPNCISKHDGEYLCGTNRYGEKVEYPKDTWLCGMCDKPLVNSECAACEISYIEVSPVIDLGDNWFGVAA